MFKPNISVTTADNLPDLTQRIRSLADLEVLVGVPEEDAARQKNQENEPITNAQLAYVHTHGSPIHKIPARPIIEPAIEDPDNQEDIAVYLKKAAEFALDGDKSNTLAELNKAGMDAQNAVRDWFTNPKNNWAPNSPITIRRKGSDRPLIDTVQLRRSMIFVVRKKD
jgi:hypothetical protein